MSHFANPEFWECYAKLSPRVRRLADKKFELLKSNPQHPSLHLKKVGIYWSVRIGLDYRALAIEVGTGLIWFWIARMTSTSACSIDPSAGTSAPASAAP